VRARLRDPRRRLNRTARLHGRGRAVGNSPELR
jgi:hypothetical protein